MAVPARAGSFAFTLDFELAWGEFYRRPVAVERLLEARRRLGDLLRLLERHRVAATFAVVGHLLLEGCDGRHLDLPRPRSGRGDWFEADPGSDERRAPAWYAPSLVRAIAAAEPGHAVAGHGFSHLPFDRPGVGADVARAELGACRRLLAATGPGGPAGPAFVFPLNRISYPELLVEQGFSCYRGVERRWYAGRARAVARAGHLLDQALSLTPPVGVVERRGAVAEVPSSMLFLSREAWRRFLPVRNRVERARRGLERAAQAGRVFHLWMHVEDLVPEPETMLAALDLVLAGARRLADRDRLAIRTMTGLVEAAEAAGR